jgi:hypothetical protein
MPPRYASRPFRWPAWYQYLSRCHDAEAPGVATGGRDAAVRRRGFHKADHLRRIHAVHDGLVPCLLIRGGRWKVKAAWRQAIELSIGS